MSAKSSIDFCAPCLSIGAPNAAATAILKILRIAVSLAVTVVGLDLAATKCL